MFSAALDVAEATVNLNHQLMNVESKDASDADAQSLHDAKHAFYLDERLLQEKQPLF